MPMDARDIELMIKAAIPDAEVTIRDLAGDGDHYAATVISDSFRGKSRVQQHQIVYQSLQGPDGRRAPRAGAADRGAWRTRGRRKLIRRAGGHGGGTTSTRRAVSPYRAEPASRVTYAELFFDLVFVFAVTQISHTLLGHFTPLGASQTTLLFLAVWWVWVYTSWITNWLDPEHTPVRLLLFVLMLGGRALNLHSQGVRIQRAMVRRCVRGDAGRPDVFLLGIDAASRTLRSRRNAIRILAWLRVGGVLDRRRHCGGQSRLVLWAVALGIEYLSPAVRFWIPEYGASSVADWVVEGGHMAERCARFIIIALGESIVVTGATFADLTWTPKPSAPSSSAFVGASRCGGSISTRAPKRGPNRFQIERAGRLARTGLYLSAYADRGRHHFSAVADELV